MQLTVTAFKKAAKRYATRHTLPLNEGQQAFSEILGFKSTHDALLRLEKTAGSPLALLEASVAPLVIVKAKNDGPVSDVFWNGLNFHQAKKFFSKIKKNMLLSDDARRVFSACVSAASYLYGGPVKAENFYAVSDIDCLIEISRSCSAGHAKFGDAVSYVVGLANGFSGYVSEIKQEDVPKEALARHFEAQKQLLVFCQRLQDFENQKDFKRPERKDFWCDLTAQQFKVLVACLFAGRRSEQAERGQFLMSVVIDVMIAEGKEGFGTAEFFSWFALDRLGWAYGRTMERFKKTNESAEVLGADYEFSKQGIVRYLDSLPDCEPRRLTARHGQNDSTKLSHNGLVSSLNHVFDVLSAIESVGGAHRCPIDHPAVDATNVREALNHLLIAQEHPSLSPAREQIIKAAEVAKMYPVEEWSVDLALQ